MVEYLDDLELRICLRVNALSRVVLLRRFFGGVSRLGDYPGWVILGVVCGAAPLDRYSFPSGHTLHAISLTVLYGAYEPMMLILMAPFAALVAASRIILGLHYPSDVLVGGTIGAALATSSLALVS